MIWREHVECGTCGRVFLLRIGVAPTREQKLIFQCPHCSVTLRLRAEALAETATVRLASEDLRVKPPRPSEEGSLPAVVLYSDLPVPVAFVNGTAPPYASPFIEWTRLWGDRALEYTSRSQALQTFREGLFPLVRRAASLYQLDDLDAIGPALGQLELDDLPGLMNEHPVYRLGRLVDLLFLPASDVTLRTAAVNEVLTYMVEGGRKAQQSYRRLLDSSARAAGFVEHRRKIVEATMSVLEHVDALLPGLAWEHVAVTPTPKPDEFRIVRADFPQLRARYVDIFELASRTLAYVGAIVNLWRRGDPNSWSDGTNRGMRSILKERSANREFILNELPFSHALYSAVPRKTRNDFGHYAIEYDVSSGELVGHGGERRSFVLFLTDYLAASRLSSFIFSLMEKLTLDLADNLSPHRRVAQAETPRDVPHQGGV